MAADAPNDNTKVGMLFVLVHGTWAPNSRWTQEGESLLCERLKSTFQKDGQRIEVFAPVWSGKNRENHRIAGGKDIAKLLREKLKSDAYDESTDVFFVTHSHGTDVALKALEEMGDDTRIRGLAALNSPNILTLKRGFAKSIAQFVIFIKIEALFVFLTTLSLIIMSYFVYLGQNSFGANVLFLIALVAIYLAFKRFSDAIVIKLDKYSEDSLDRDFRKKMSEKNEVPVLVINSSSDEAWNVLNLFTTLAQLPFYMTHRFVVLFMGIIFFYILTRHAVMPEVHQPARDWFFFFNDLTSYDTIARMAAVVEEKVDELYVDVQNVTNSWNSWKYWFEMSVLSAAWWLGAFSSVVAVALLNVGLVAASSLVVGYVLALLVELVALGMPRRPPLEFLSTRKCVGLVPLSSTNVYFYDADVGGSFLDHSLPYNSKSTLDRIMDWISGHSRNKGSLRKQGTEK
jgi:hypothetical protein